MFALVGFTDDIAVLTTALALINGHIKERHYDAAGSHAGGRAAARRGLIRRSSTGLARRSRDRLFRARTGD